MRGKWSSFSSVVECPQCLRLNQSFSCFSSRDYLLNKIFYEPGSYKLMERLGQLMKNIVNGMAAPSKSAVGPIWLSHRLE